MARKAVEVVKPTKKKVDVEKKERCIACNGTGLLDRDNLCTLCDGTGEV